MKPFVRKLLQSLVEKLVLQGKDASVEILRIKVTSAYLKVVGGVRKSVLGAVGLFLILIILIVGFVGIHVGLFILLDWDLRTVGIVTLCLGAVYFLVPLGLVLYATSEKTWMKMSRGKELVNKALKPKQK